MKGKTLLNMLGPGILVAATGAGAGDLATASLMLEGFSLGSYLLLVDYTSRLCRTGKARVSAGVAGNLDQLGTSAEVWQHRLKRMLAKQRLLGNYFATDRQQLRQLAEQRGVHHLDHVVAG